MKESFVVRFNLEKQTNACCKNQVKALSGLFGENEKELLESIDFYNDFLKKNADNFLSEIDKKCIEKIKNKNIAFFGDSITSDKMSFANIIKCANVFNSVDIFAVSGIVSSQLIRDFKCKITENKYDIIVVFIGTNDSALTDIDFPFISADEYERNIEYIAKIVKESNRKLVFFTLPCHSEKIYKNGTIISDLYNDKIKKIINKYDFEVFEINNNELLFLDDNVHFDYQTQEKLSKSFFNYIVNNERLI